MNRTEWDRKRVDQYAARTNQPLEHARYYLHRIYTEEGRLNLAAVDAQIDPNVDIEFKSCNRPVSHLI